MLRMISPACGWAVPGQFSADAEEVEKAPVRWYGGFALLARCKGGTVSITTLKRGAFEDWRRPRPLLDHLFITRLRWPATHDSRHKLLQTECLDITPLSGAAAHVPRQRITTEYLRDQPPRSTQAAETAVPSGSSRCAPRRQLRDWQRSIPAIRPKQSWGRNWICTLQLRMRPDSGYFGKGNGHRERR